MSMIKYRIHEVAKDFNVPSKLISQILTDYVAAPKNHMQVLENHELDVIFEYMTQHNQAASLEEIFNTAPKAELAKAPAAQKQQAAAEKSRRPEGIGRLKSLLPSRRPRAPLSRRRRIRRINPMFPARWRRSGWLIPEAARR